MAMVQEWNFTWPLLSPGASTDAQKKTYLIPD